MHLLPFQKFLLEQSPVLYPFHTSGLSTFSRNPRYSPKESAIKTSMDFALPNYFSKVSQ